MKITYITPQTEAELEPFIPWLCSLLETLPDSVRPEPDKMRDAAESFLREVTFPYLEDLPLGCFAIRLSKKSAEIHGITRPDLKELIGKAAGPVIGIIGRQMLETIFMEHEKKLVIAKVPDDAIGAQGFLRRWGFRPMEDKNTGKKLDKGRRVYVLKREQFIKNYLGASK